MTAIETTLRGQPASFDAIQGQASLGVTSAGARDLEKQTYRMVLGRVHDAGRSRAVSIPLSPVLVPVVGLQYHQLGIFRLVLAALFQFMFVAATSIVLFL